LTGVSILKEKQSIPIINRYKENRIPDESISLLEHVKEIKNEEKLNSKYSNIKLKNESQYDEIIIPNWTYSTGLGVVYNPIREKYLKVTKRNFQKKIKPVDSIVHSIVKLNDNTSVRLIALH
jgi:hypothetical protein